jgi:tetratricopeptide (TPR) repeat protein
MKRAAQLRLAHAFALSTFIMLAGCAASNQVILSSQREATANANGRALRYFTQGDFAGARVQAQRALDAAASVEDEDGIASSLLNISLIEQRLGHPQSARQAVDRMLLDSDLNFSAKSKSEAALRRAVLAIDDGDRLLTEQLLRQVEKFCPSDCTLQGKVANLRAQMAIEEGRMQEAVAQAELGLKASRERNDAEEEANALRLGANAMVHIGNADGAAKRLEEALLIDKSLGLSRKLFRDLLLLGLAAKRSQQAEVAIRYWRRAREVAQADHNAAGVKEVDGFLAMASSEKLTEGMK